MLGRLKDVKMLEGCIVPIGICQLIKKKKKSFLHKKIIIPAVAKSTKSAEDTTRIKDQMVLAPHTLFPCRVYSRNILCKSIISSESAGFHILKYILNVLVFYASNSLWHEPYLFTILHLYLVAIINTSNDHFWTIRQHFSPYTGADLSH